jgi:hypothetical protein
VESVSIPNLNSYNANLRIAFILIFLKSLRQKSAKKSPSANPEGLFFILNYFFLYPFGHTGFTAVTFLLILPLTQVIVDFFAEGAAVAVGAGSAFAGAPCDNFTLIVGDEKVKLLALR